MITDKPFRIAFLLSLGLHSILFTPLFNLCPRVIIKDNTHIEVTYTSIKEELLDTKPFPIKDIKVSLKEEEKVVSKEEVLHKDKTEERLTKKDLEEKKDILKKDRIDKAPLSRVDFDLNSISLKQGTSDSLNYLYSVRNKINAYVHRNYDSSMGQGEVFLHFLLNQDGSVRLVSIVNDNLDNNENLRNLCLNSIYHSSPFKSFPKDLDLPYAAFNISISFKKR